MYIWSNQPINFKEYKLKTITTHNGLFHADEVLAIALLKEFTKDEYHIMRTRNANLISISEYAIDVGGIYDPANGQFDHHQFEKDHKLYGLSSAGLVWRNLSIDDMSSIDLLVKEVDQQDVGITRNAENHFCMIVTSYNTQSIYSFEQDGAFKEAVQFACRYVQNLVRYDTLAKK